MAYGAFLRQAEIVSRPDGEEWKAMIARISVTGAIAAIDEETFFNFLEVLPPKFQQGSLFAFAEGAESLRVFWLKGDAHCPCDQAIALYAPSPYPTRRQADAGGVHLVRAN